MGTDNPAAADPPEAGGSTSLHRWLPRHLVANDLLDDASGLALPLAGASYAMVLTVDNGTAALRSYRGSLPDGHPWNGECTALPGWDELAAGLQWTGVVAGFTHLAAPVMADSEVVALLVVGKEAPHSFSGDTIEAMTILAGHVATGLATISLYRTVQAGEASLRLITDSISDLVALVDSDGRFVYASPSHRRQLGIDPDSLVGQPVTVLAHVDDRPALLFALTAEAAERTVEYRIRSAQGSWTWVESAVRAAADDRTTMVLSSRLVDERKQLEQELRHQATHDPLTGLANRALATRRLEEALSSTAEEEVGLLFCDVDRFKAINDRLGHDAGDRLLVEVTERLRRVFRPHDLLARFGGDEFVVVLGAVPGLYGVAQVGRRVLEAMKEPFVLLGEPVTVSFSIGGVASARGSGVSATDLLRDADAAMYAAKEAGRGRLQIFDDLASLRSLERLDLRSELDRGIDTDQLRLHYQPIVDLRTGQVTGFEALLRWHHPVRGDIAPEEFVSLAEETGAITTIGRWALRTACATLARWRTELPIPGLTMHVNLSTVQLDDAELIEDVLAALNDFDLPASQLWLEITERGVVPAKVAAPIAALRAAGLRFALDDFGVSLSNLALLRELSPECLKIDRSFVGGLSAGNETDRAIVKAMVSIAEWMNLDVVAEGVESEDHRSRLVEMGCWRGQGFHFAPPAPPEEITELMLRTGGTLEV